MMLLNKEKIEVAKASTEEKHSDFYDLLLVLLDLVARKVIYKEYPNRSYELFDAKILEVKRLTGGYSQYDFSVKIHYDTSTGPFNPPEGSVTTDEVSVTSEP